ncbi:MAG: hypothetical protein ABIZ91_14620 [Gemmatimonadaceae bacterium]
MNTRLVGIVVVALAGLAAGSSEATAQQASPVAAQPVNVGSRVRIFAPSLRRDRYVGRVDSLNVGEVVLDTAGVRRRLGFEMGPVLVDEFRLVTIRTSAIERVEVSGGRTTRGSTIKGLLIGGLGGALLFGFGQLPEVNPKAKDFFKGAPLGLVVGAVGGGIVGYALGGERWVPGELPR